MEFMSVDDIETNRQVNRSQAKENEPMDLGIEGKVALVAAASRGLGRGCARHLAAEQCRVAICGRDGEAAQRTAREISSRTGSQVVAFSADVSRAQDIQRLLADVRKTLGDPQIVVTNAGGPPPGTFAGTPLEAYEPALHLNLMSAVHLIHGVVPAMKAQQWGRIIAITSIAVKQPNGNLLLSNMARAGLTGFLKTVATELAPFDITVNALLPGTHQTSRIDQLAEERAHREKISVEQVLRDMVTQIPCRTMGDPDDFGAAAAFLAGEQAKYITGQSLLIDGGQYGGLF
jgi:3-oxoacyl-[acyl-carrier protein] reductase